MGGEVHRELHLRPVGSDRAQRLAGAGHERGPERPVGVGGREDVRRLVRQPGEPEQEALVALALRRVLAPAGVVRAMLKKRFTTLNVRVMSGAVADRPAEAGFSSRTSGRSSRTNGRMRFSTVGVAPRRAGAAPPGCGPARARRAAARSEAGPSTSAKRCTFPSVSVACRERGRQLAHGRGDVLVLGRVGAEDARGATAPAPPGRAPCRPARR